MSDVIERDAATGEVERLRQGLRDLKQEIFEMVLEDTSLPTIVFHIVGGRVDALLGDDNEEEHDAEHH